MNVGAPSGELLGRLEAGAARLHWIRSLPNEKRDELGADEITLLATMDELLDELVRRGRLPGDPS